jgi:hypothetical protein
MQNSGKCKKCQHRFVFEPTNNITHKKLTDQLFANAIAHISANNTLYFTTKQFEYFLDRQFTPNTKPSIDDNRLIILDDQNSAFYNGVESFG